MKRRLRENAKVYELIIVIVLLAIGTLVLFFSMRAEILHLHEHINTLTQGQMENHAKRAVWTVEESGMGV